MRAVITKIMFDPLHSWFGIPPQEQPPNHYRLLGVSLFESSADVIDTAYDKQMTFLHGCANGDHAELAESLMNQVSAARLTLVNPDKRASYDAALRRASASPVVRSGTTQKAADPIAPAASPPQTSSPIRPSLRPLPPPIRSPAATNPFISLRSRSSAAATESSQAPQLVANTSSPVRRRKRKNWLLPTFSVLVSVLLIGIGFLVVELVDPSKQVPPASTSAAGSSSPTIERQQTPVAPNQQSSPTIVNSPAPTVRRPQNRQTASQNPRQRIGAPVREAMSPTTPATAASIPVPEGLESLSPNTGNALAESMRLPIPDVASIARSQALMVELYADKNAAATTPRQKIELAKQMYQVGIETNDDTVGRYVLWKLFALPILLGNGDFLTAFEVIDSLEQHYQVAGLTEKATILLAVPQPQLQRAPEIVSQFEPLVHQAIAEEQYTVASQLALQWREILSSSRRHSVDEFIAKIEQLQNSQQDYLAARQRLTTTSDDPAANLNVGRYLCFAKEQWEQGFPHLIASGDKTLAEVASLETKYAESFAKTVEMETQMADQWYDIASKETDQRFRDAIGQRALQWYRVALPRMASGVNKVKAEKRSAELANYDSGAEVSANKRVLGYQRFDSKESSFDSFRRRGNEFTVSMGKAEDGKGEACVGVELTGVSEIFVAINGNRKVAEVDRATKLGFFIDYGSPTGYRKRVFLALGEYEYADFNSNPYWGTASPPNEIFNLRPKRVYELNLSDNAPADWDGRCWFSLYMQNAGFGCTAQANLRF